MGKQQAFWRYSRQVRRCASKAQPQVAKLSLEEQRFFKVIAVMGAGVGGLLLLYHNTATRNQKQTEIDKMAQRIEVMQQQNKDKEKEWEQQTEAYLDKMLEKIVTASYEPEVPNGREYVPRQQDGTLEKDLGENIASNTYFFMLTGESGSGKTTMMQHFLKEKYKEGVIFVAVNADKLANAPSDMMRGVVEAAVLEQFEECKDHPRHHPAFTGFIKHANEVRKRAKAKEKEKAHPLIIYITLDTKTRNLSYETMHDIAVAVGGMASDLSSKENCCKTILELSKTGISDALKQIRTDFARFEVGAMTEEELQAIGKQLVLEGPQDLALPEAKRKKLLAKKDPQNLIEPYLKHYHDWLGGQTKTLVGFVEDGARSDSMQSLCCLLYNMIINYTSHRSCVCHR